MERLSEEQISEFKDAFALFDKKGDNKIEVNQIGDVMRALGLNPSEGQVKKTIGEVDPSGHKRLSFEEYLPIYIAANQKKEQGSLEDFVEALRVFDKDGNGLINSAELRHVLTSLGEKLTDEEVDTLLTGLEDSQGQVNYEEFIKMVIAA